MQGVPRDAVVTVACVCGGNWDIFGSGFDDACAGRTPELRRGQPEGGASRGVGRYSAGWNPSINWRRPRAAPAMIARNVTGAE